MSTRADEPFFRGDEPERSPSHTVVASQTAALIGWAWVGDLFAA